MREKYNYKREVLFIIYNKSCDYYKAPLILGYPRVTYYLKAFLDPTHGYLAKKRPGPRGPMGPTRGFWSSLQIHHTRKLPIPYVAPRLLQ